MFEIRVIEQLIYNWCDLSPEIETDNENKAIQKTVADLNEQWKW